MSLKSAEMHKDAEKENKVCWNPGPLDYKSREEWIRWLEYIPDLYCQRIDYLSAKKENLSNEELGELSTFQVELKMSTIAENYQNPTTSIKERLEYLKYTAHQENLEKLIHKKLTAEEYKIAMQIIHEIVEESSFEELSHYCKSSKDNFNNLSMIELFILREVCKELSIQSTIDLENRIDREKRKKC